MAVVASSRITRGKNRRLIPAFTPHLQVDSSLGNLPVDKVTSPRLALVHGVIIFSDISCIKTRPHHTTASWASLVAYPAMHWLQAVRDGSSLSAWTCSILPDGAHHAVRSCTQPSWTQVGWVEDCGSTAHSFITWRHLGSSPCVEQSAVVTSRDRFHWQLYGKLEDIFICRCCYGVTCQLLCFYSRWTARRFVVPLCNFVSTSVFIVLCYKVKS